MAVFHKCDRCGEELKTAQLTFANRHGEGKSTADMKGGGLDRKNMGVDYHIRITTEGKSLPGQTAAGNLTYHDLCLRCIVDIVQGNEVIVVAGPKGGAA